MHVHMMHACVAPANGYLQGTSRGGANIKEIVRRIDLWGLDMVFVIGGNGGNAAANAIQQEVERQGVRCVVAGVPKSIDNDILLVSGDAAQLCLHNSA
jgi:6-phosphofructokinase 1